MGEENWVDDFFKKLEDYLRLKYNVNPAAYVNDIVKNGHDMKRVDHFVEDVMECLTNYGKSLDDLMEELGKTMPFGDPFFPGQGVGPGRVEIYFFPLDNFLNVKKPEQHVEKESEWMDVINNKESLDIVIETDKNIFEKIKTGKFKLKSNILKVPHINKTITTSKYIDTEEYSLDLDKISFSHNNGIGEIKITKEKKQYEKSA